jgi:peptidyl-prolyl cis-trans isomerase D
MLNVMRENLTHLKPVLWVVAFAMVLYLGSYFFESGQGNGSQAGAWVARVDGEPIGLLEFQRAARREDDQWRRRLGTQYDAFRKQLRIGTQVADNLINARIMRAEARALGLDTSKAELAEVIQAQFADDSGKFVGIERYQEILRQNDYVNAAEFESQMRDQLVASKWAAIVTQAAAVSDAELERLYRSRNEKGAFDYVFVASGAQNVSASVSEADLAAWHTTNQDRYRRGEARRVKLLIVERQGQLAKATVSDDEIRAHYEANRADFARPEQRRASHVLLRVEPSATPDDRRSIRELALSVLARAQKGEDIAALARAMSQDPGSASNGGDLGWFGRGAMTGPFDQAAFATPVGQLAPLVETEFGYHVLKVTDAREAGAVAIDEVRDSIRRNLEVQKAERLVRSEADRLAALVKSPADLDAVAAKEGLKVDEKLLAREDAARELGASPEFVNAVFATPAGQIAAPAAIARGFAIAAIAEVLPPSVRPLAEVRAQVTADVLAERGREAALSAARRALGAGSLQAAAKSLRSEVKSSGDVVPGFTLAGPGRSIELEKVVFAPTTSVGSTGVAPAPGGAVIYAITRHETFDKAAFENAKAALREEIVNRRKGDLLGTILTNLRKKYAVEINNELIERNNG